MLYLKLCYSVYYRSCLCFVKSAWIFPFVISGSYWYQNVKSSEKVCVGLLCDKVQMEWRLIHYFLMCVFILVYLHPLMPLQVIMFLISFPIFAELLFQKRYLAVKLHLRKTLSCDHTSLKDCTKRAYKGKKWILPCFPRHSHMNKIMQIKGAKTHSLLSK